MDEIEFLERCNADTKERDGYEFGLCSSQERKSQGTLIPDSDV